MSRFFAPALGLCAASTALLCLAPATATAETVPLGTSTGTLAVVFNDNNETASNISYIKAQFSPTNDNGQAFSFAANPAAAAAFGDQGQFGIDLILEAATNTGTVPTLTAFDNTNNNVSGRSAAGSVAWAINDYKGGSTDSGPADENSSVINSLFRGGEIRVTQQSLTQFGTLFTLAIEGLLVGDGTIHFYNPGTPDAPASNFGLTGNIAFNGVFTYNSATDINGATPGVDFYNGTALFQAEVVPSPAAVSGGLALLGLVATRRRGGRAAVA